ncbi:hypothetical protein Nmel_002442 [Mimus melanotis]
MFMAPTCWLLLHMKPTWRSLSMLVQMKYMEVVLMGNLMNPHQNVRQIPMPPLKQLQSVLFSLIGKGTNFQLSSHGAVMFTDHISIQRKLFQSLYLCCNRTENAVFMVLDFREGISFMQLMW